MKPVQNHNKIAVKFYVKRANAKSSNFTLKKSCGKISPPKARLRPSKTRQKSAKRLKSRRRKILTMKFRPQISPCKIALDGGGI